METRSDVETAGGWISKRDACRRLRISERTLFAYSKAGKLRSKKMHDAESHQMARFFSVESVVELINKQEAAAVNASASKPVRRETPQDFGPADIRRLIERQRETSHLLATQLGASTKSLVAFTEWIIKSEVTQHQVLARVAELERELAALKSR